MDSNLETVAKKISEGYKTYKISFDDNDSVKQLQLEIKNVFKRNLNNGRTNGDLIEVHNEGNDSFIITGKTTKENIEQTLSKLDIFKRRTITRYEITDITFDAFIQYGQKNSPELEFMRKEKDRLEEILVKTKIVLSDREEQLLQSDIDNEALKKEERKLLQKLDIITANSTFSNQVQVIEAIVKTYMQENKKAVDLYQSLQTEYKTEINIKEILKIKDKPLIDYIKENLKLEPLLEDVITAKDLADLQRKLTKTKNTSVEETTYYKNNNEKYDKAKAEHKLLTDMISTDSDFNKTQKSFQKMIYGRKMKNETVINEFEAKIEEYNVLKKQNTTLLENIDQLNQKYEIAQKLSVEKMIIYAGITKEINETNYGITMLLPSDSIEMNNSHLYSLLLTEIEKSALQLEKLTGNDIEPKESIIKFNLNYKRGDISEFELEKEKEKITEKITAHFKETLLGKLGYELRLITLNEASSKDNYQAETAKEMVTQEQKSIDDNVNDNKHNTLDIKTLILDYLKKQNEPVKAGKITKYIYEIIAGTKTKETIDRKIIKEFTSGSITGYIYENRVKIIEEEKLAKSVSGKLSYLIEKEVIKRKGDKGNYTYYLSKIGLTEQIRQYLGSQTEPVDVKQITGYIVEQLGQNYNPQISKNISARLTRLVQIGDVERRGEEKKYEFFIRKDL